MFPIIPVWYLNIIAVAMLFLLVLLHELGHSFIAMKEGLHVRQILLTPIGGIAQITGVPLSRYGEIEIAAAGPVVNIFFGALTAALMLISGMGMEAIRTSGAGWYLVYLFLVINLMLAFFNLLPVFPMDGGRILRGVLSLRMDFVRATGIAVTTGKVMAALMVLVAFWQQMFVLLFIALFVYFAGEQEKRFAPIIEEARRYHAASSGAYSGYSYFFAKSQGEQPAFLSADAPARAPRRGFFAKLGEARREKKRRKAAENAAARRARVDEILAKVSREGIGSLTAKEKKFLKEASGDFKKD